MVAFIVAGAVLSALIMVLCGTGLRKWIYPVLLGLMVLFILIFRAEVTEGTLEIINGFLDKLTLSTGKIFLDYEALGAGVEMALGLIFAILAMLFAGAAVLGSMLPILPLAMIAAVGGMAGAVPVGAGLALLAVGMIVIPLKGGIGNLRVDGLRLAAAVICIALALGLGLILRNANLQDLSKTAQLKIHEIKYDSETNAMPEGRLADLGPFKKTETEALAVTMDDPEKLYLRGHVYEVYTGSSWEELPAEERAEGEALFYWLHQNGFYGQGQIAQAMSAAGLDEETQKVKIENLSACKATSYLPYALRDNSRLDASLIGDAAWGNDMTELSIYSGSVAKWYETQYELASGQGSKDTDSYMALEQSYAGYVKEHDLQLTQESWNVLRRKLGEVEGSRSLYEIQSLIREYLEDALHYDENAYTLSGEGDFLNYVLERSDGGAYSVQYATAAALMLRYYGVPSRYVEGYYLTPEQAEKAEAGEKVILTEENAHAWAEYYLNGVGFVPFEVTPGYIDPEDLDFGVSGNGDGEGLYQYQSNAMTYAITEEPEKEKPDTGQKDLFRFDSKILLLLIPLLILAFIVFVISRRIRLARALRAIDCASNRYATAMRYGYAMAIKDRAMGILLPEDEEAYHINELALFSRQEITDEDRKHMDEYASKVLKEAKKTWNMIRKLRLRLIDGIY